MTPDATGDFFGSGVFDEHPYFRNPSGYYLWFNIFTDQWWITIDLGVEGEGQWRNNSGSILGTYSNSGTFTGDGTLVFGSQVINWLAGWQARKQISIQGDQVTETLSDFPVLVQISADADLSSALATGADVRFTLSTGTDVLPYEIEAWSGGGGAPVTASIWVKVPSIAAVTGASLNMYYNNPDASDAQEGSGVWSNGYRLVAHLPDLTTLTVKDSTQYNMTLTKRDVGRPTENDGVIAKCQDGSALSSWIGGENTPAIDITEAPLTISAWIKKTTVAYGWILAKNLDLLTNVQFGIDSYPDPVTGGISCWLDGIQRCESASGSLLLNTWTHVAFTWDGTTCQAYINGLASGIPEPFSGTLASRPFFFIGKREPTAAWFLGLYDEIRIAAAARSAAWLKFQYQNQSSVDNELTFGVEQSL